MRKSSESIICRRIFLYYNKDMQQNIIIEILLIKVSKSYQYFLIFLLINFYF